MKSRLPLVLALAGLAGCGFTSLAINAYADPVAAQATDQSSPQAADQRSSDDAASNGASEHFHFSDADRAAFLDARIAALHAGLVLTPSQEKLWPSVESALRDTHKVIADQRAARRTAQRPADPVAWLQRVSDNTMARAEALKKLADAAGPLYSALNEDQKNRLPFLLHAAHFHFFGARFADNDGWRGHHDWRGDRGGDDMQGRDGETDRAPDEGNSQ